MNLSDNLRRYWYERTSNGAKGHMMSMVLLMLFLFLGAGCLSNPGVEPNEIRRSISEPSSVVFPVENYPEGRWVKTFGEYVDDRFTGYHVGDDVEPDTLERETPVVAVADGTVARVGFVDGYGGLVAIEHDVDDETVTALYGHLDLGSVLLKPGDAVEMGQFIGNLGDDRSEETDGERKHLHFGLYEGSSGKINGYEARETAVLNWVNPTDFFNEHGLDAATPGRRVDPDVERGGDTLRLVFDIPEGWEMEWIPQIEAWNLFTPSRLRPTVSGTTDGQAGEGSARDRSQMLIRYFDASDFLTLSTVTIHSSEYLVVGVSGYTARHYDIEKKPGVANFMYQPQWRNNRHIVTDFRGAEGRTRYYVVASNPELDRETYEEVLSSMEIK